MISQEQKDFSDRLAYLRIQNELSCRKLSDEIDKSPSYINNIEAGYSFPTMESFFIICRVLGISPCEFFEYYEKNQTKKERILHLSRHLSDRQLDAIIHMMQIMSDENH